MTDSIYVPGRGILYRLDPRSKLFVVLVLILYLAFESQIGLLLSVLGGLHVVSLLASSTRRPLLSLWRALAPLLLLVVVLGSLRWRPDEALLSLGPVAVTAPALWAALGRAARILALSLALSLLLWSTEPGDMVAGLTRLGVPFIAGFAVVMALQYVVSFQHQFRQILEAQQSRGLVFSPHNPVQIVRAYVPVLIPLIITALRTADNLALALQSRGFVLHQRRTSRRTPHMRPGDWILILAAGAMLAGLSLV